LLTSVPASGIEAATGMAQGRMKKKVLAAGEALAGGVSRVIIADARTQRPVSVALEGAGTVFA
jgi:acetylglutamate/LysW-gamma-L-alpha-aminoadipate kinase